MVLPLKATLDRAGTQIVTISNAGQREKKAPDYPDTFDIKFAQQQPKSFPHLEIFQILNFTELPASLPVY